jgi:hypothetical protein
VAPPRRELAAVGVHEQQGQRLMSQAREHHDAEELRHGPAGTGSRLAGERVRQEEHRQP